MAETVTFKVFVRVAADGKTTALTEHDGSDGRYELDHCEFIDLDDPYRDVVLEVTASLPERREPAVAAVAVPDEAAEAPGVLSVAPA